MTRRRRHREPLAPFRLPMRLGWVLTLVGGLLLFGALLQPAVQAKRETMDEISRLRAEIAAQSGAGPQWLEESARMRSAVGVPQFYQLPVTTAPEVEAHARATMMTTQMLDLVKTVGGEVVQVAVEMPQRLPHQVHVPGKIVFRGDFDSVRHLVKAVRGISPQLLWRRCKLVPLRPGDELDADPLPMNALTVELGWTAIFHRAD
jgi:hypothetical protein